MNVEALWQLRVRTERLELRLPTEAELVALFHVAETGIHPPEEMPFGVAWTDNLQEEAFLESHRNAWATWPPEQWTCNLITFFDGRPIGTQGISSAGFPTTRVVETGSWLGAPYQGRGLGTEQRAAVLEGVGPCLPCSEHFTSPVRGTTHRRYVPIVSLMRLLLRERIFPLIVLLGIGGILPVSLLLSFGHRMVMFGTPMHFVGVGVSALAAAAVSLALTIVGVRRNDGRVVLIGTGFTVMSALLAIHGLATPGALIGPNGVISLTGAATLPAGAAVLALSALPPLRQPRSMRALLTLQGCALLAVMGLGVVGMAFPRVVPPVPAPGSGGAVAALIVGVALFSVLLLRALKTYLLTHRSADMVVVIGIAWLTAALPPALLMNYMDLGWWLGHLFELLGIIAVGATVAVDLFRSVQSRSLVGDLRAGDLVAQEEAFLGARVRALTRLLADKDESTEEHTRRVALRAVQVGEELGLAPGRLRQLAIGGLLHDIGKLSVPERILKKPAALDDTEFAAIKLHPGRGVQLLRELGGFAAAIHDLVHSHHERLDGKGYPRGLTDCELSLDTRILTVCDVYDALVSPRVYREAWTHHAAVALLRDETGTAFDERCVAALERVLSREGQGEHAPMPVLRVAAAGA